MFVCDFEKAKHLTLQHFEEKILYLHKTYYPKQGRIMWHLVRCHDIKISGGAVYNVLKCNGLNRLQQNQSKRSLKAFQRYEKKG
jgi:hypothetical protein